MTEEEKEKLISDHWFYIWQVLVHHSISFRERRTAQDKYFDGFYDGLSDSPKKYNVSTNFHYSTAYDHGKKHLEQYKC